MNIETIGVYLTAMGAALLILKQLGRIARNSLSLVSTWKSLSETVPKLAKAMSDLNESINAINLHHETLKGQVAALDGRVTVLEQQIE